MGLVKLLVILALAFVVYQWWRSARPTQRPRPRPRIDPAEPARDRPAHEVLGVTPDATQAEIKAAYQRLIRQYHPDRVADLGPEIRAVAERRAKEINAAYDALARD